MKSWFELWDAQNASLVGTYDSQEAALAVVRRSLASFGEGSLRSLVLTQEDAEGADPRVLAAGADLIALARRTEPSLAGAGRGEEMARGS